MIYLDASVVVTVLTLEANSQRTLSWVDLQGVATLCVSGWVETEVSSALARKVRMGLLTMEGRAALLAKWRDMTAESILTVSVPDDAFHTAARLIDQPKSRLRAGDALHLAIASLGGHSLATLDAWLGEAATDIGVSVEAIG